MKYVQVIHQSGDYKQFDSMISIFIDKIQKNGAEIIDITMSNVIDDNYLYYTALIIYEKQEQKHENQEQELEITYAMKVIPANNKELK